MQSLCDVAVAIRFPHVAQMEWIDCPVHCRFEHQDGCLFLDETTHPLDTGVHVRTFGLHHVRTFRCHVWRVVWCDGVICAKTHGDGLMSTIEWESVSYQRKSPDRIRGLPYPFQRSRLFLCVLPQQSVLRPQHRSFGVDADRTHP